MDSYITTILILAICIILVVVMYRVGVEIGKVTVLREHPGYETYRFNHISNAATN